MTRKIKFDLLILPALCLTGCSVMSSAEQGESLKEYVSAIHQHVEEKWAKPAGSYRCEVRVRQDKSGYIQEVELIECPDGEVGNSVLKAIVEASPLPKPNNAEIFESEIRFMFHSKE